MTKLPTLPYIRRLLLAAPLAVLLTVQGCIKDIRDDCEPVTNPLCHKYLTMLK